MTDKDFYWLVGLLEGEGYFGIIKNTPTIALQMTDADVVEKSAQIMGTYSGIGSYSVHEYKRKVNWKPTYQFTMKGKKALALMTAMKPYLSKRRQEQINSVIDTYNPEARLNYHKTTRIIENSSLPNIIKDIEGGKSLRACARTLGVHHESLRQALIRFKSGRRAF